jgi:hypothetical protein
MTSDELALAIRDSVAMENCKTYSELEYVCRNLEARHKVEGISPMDLAAYENVKRQHILRVCRGMVA